MARFHSTKDGNVPYTPEEEAEADAHSIVDAWAAIRISRNRLLSESDWVILRAYSRGEPVPAEWAAYQQALRDITQQPDPLSVAWPSKPQA